MHYLSTSSMNAWQFAPSLHLTERHRWTRFVCMQNHYNLLYREEGREIMPNCQTGHRHDPLESAGRRERTPAASPAITAG